jgi:hypothetical protein
MSTMSGWEVGVRRAQAVHDDAAGDCRRGSTVRPGCGGV